MEAEKLQRLHDSLSKLAPKSKSGLGVGGLGAHRVSLDETLPKNRI